MAQLRLDKVLFAPAGVQPLKPERRATPPEQRAHMVELAIAGHPLFELSRADLDRPGPHFTVDLLAIVRRQYPDAILWFIMGTDELSDLLRWHDPARLFLLARIAVLRRTGFEPDWPALESALPGLRTCIDWIDISEINISASAIRARVSRGQSIEHLVPVSVARYIAEQRLYQGHDL